MLYPPMQPPSFIPSTPSIPMASPPLLQQQSQSDGAAMHTIQSNTNPSIGTMYTVKFHNPGSGSSSNETEATTTSSSSITTNIEDWLDNGSVQCVSSDLSNSANNDAQTGNHNLGKLSVLYYNAWSVLPKLDNLAATCLTCSPDIVCIVESWLCSDISENEISLPNYSIIKLDRNRQGGGILLYVKITFPLRLYSMVLLV